MTPSPTPTAPAVPLAISPRIARLRTALADDPRAVEQFWKEVEESGTPFVEEIAGDPDHLAVTFLWRGKERESRVLLNVNRIGRRDRRHELLLHRLEHTDVWHLTLRLRSDHRASYQVAADDGSTSGLDADELQEQLTSLAACAAPDPLCKSTVDSRRSTSAASVFALPDAPAPAWADLSIVDRGRTEQLFWAGCGDIVGRTVHRHRTPGADAAWRVVVLTDGDAWFGHLGLGPVLDALVEAGRLAPLTVLSPDAISVQQRWQDLSGRADWIDAMADHVLPLAGSPRPDRHRTVIAGQSLGGLTAVLGALRRPEVFGAAVAQSPSLWWSPEAGAGFADNLDPDRVWLADQARTISLPDSRIRLDTGTHEGAMPAMSRQLSAALTDAGAQSTVTEYTGGHDYVCWRVALIDGLIDLLGDGSADRDDQRHA